METQLSWYEWRRETNAPLGGVAVVAIIAAILSGCGAGAPQPGGTKGTSIDLSRLIIEAREGGASAGQIAALERASKTGVMSFEALNALVPAVLDCIESTGASVRIGTPREAFPGVMVPDYSVSPPSGATADEVDRVRELSNACEQKEWSHALTYYLSQPSSVESYEQGLLGSAQEIRACLAGHHIDVPVDASAGEISAALSQDEDTNGALSGWEPCYHGGFISVG